jgi:Flp pilus assembly protein CpaB
MSGVLDRQPTPTPPKPEPVMVLVAKTNIFENMTVTPLEVMVREATAEERSRRESSPGNYLAASVEAATLRIAARHIFVGEMLKKDDFLDPSIPDPPSKRLGPGMRSVNVVLPKDRAAGGLIRIGENVDVFLTTAICSDARCINYRTATAPLALNLKVVIKRDSLWTMMQALPEGKPVSYTIEANPYRAALIEMAKTKGLITLVPSAGAAKDRMSPSALRVEESRAAAFLAGEVVVSEDDLQRIFNLAPIQTPEPPLSTEHYVGLQYAGTKVHDRRDRNLMPTQTYSFRSPTQISAGAASGGGFQLASQADNPADCPNCGKTGTPPR